MPKTKIIATLGPASASLKTIKKLVSSGVNVFRLNFSHGDLKWHTETVRKIRRVKEGACILGDLCGPKIRVEKLFNEEIKIKRLSEYILKGALPKTESEIQVNHKIILKDIKRGHKVLMDDGALSFKCLKSSASSVRLKALSAGVLKIKKGINLPDSRVSIPTITEKDIKDLKFAVKNGVNLIALSFVRTKDDIVNLRKILKKLKSGAFIISKIERPESLKNIDGIIENSDGVMIARGDLAVEVNKERLPFIQKDILKRCFLYGKFTIVATQVLESMVNSISPTRAEITDISNSVLDGADAIMLSAETSVGANPPRAVSVLRKVSRYAEKKINVKNFPSIKGDCVSSAICDSAYFAAKNLHAKCVIAFSYSGDTARFISKHRLNVPVYVFSPAPATLKKTEVLYNVQSFKIKKHSDFEKMLSSSIKTLRLKKLLKKGDKAVIIAGVPLLERGNTNTLKVVCVK